MTATGDARLTSLAHGGGCGCKIAPATLDRLLAAAGDVGLAPPPDLLIDAATRDDAAVYRLSASEAIVATTDFFTPIVDDPYDFGRIAATNALSDVYAMGATPIFCLAILGMPIDKLAPETIGEIVRGGRDVAAAAGAPVAGGHSIDAAEPIYGLVAIGRAHPDKILTNAGARAGDVLILGKPLGVGVFSAAFKQGRLAPADYDAMIASTTLLNQPGAALADLRDAHAMTDVTGFGLLGHALEMARGAALRIKINRADVPVFDGVDALLADGVRTGASGRNWESVNDQVDADGLDQAMRDLLTDPQTSGGLLVAAAPDAAGAVLDVFRAAGHNDAAVIGRVEDGPPRIAIA
ncbi:MAG: selenide, water dikinase SelD [Pseudomonadota bacterium]